MKNAFKLSENHCPFCAEIMSKRMGREQKPPDRQLTLRVHKNKEPQKQNRGQMEKTETMEDVGGK